jgi:hypothetical protein
VLVAVDNAHLATIHEVAERGRAAGLEVDQILDKIGTITGAIDPGRIAELSKVPGVAGVERAGEYDIGPPGSGLQ